MTDTENVFDGFALLDDDEEFDVMPRSADGSAVRLQRPC